MLKIHYQEKIDSITSWIRKTVTDAGFADVIVGVSGGVDSAVALTLVVRALGKEHVYAVMLPYKTLSDVHVKDAEELMVSLDLPKNHIAVFNIAQAVDSITIDTKETDNIRKGNIMARLRMIYLYDLSKKHNALVVGTENKSEYYLGYFTRFGDEASDLEPIRSLYKTQVWEMAKVLGVPNNIIAKAPTAGLWMDQTDEKEFGFSYKDADKILYHYFEEKLPIEGIVALGLEKSLVEKVLKRVKENSFKHNLPHVFT